MAPVKPRITGGQFPKATRHAVGEGKEVCRQRAAAHDAPLPACVPCARCATQAAAWCARVCAALQVFISQGGKSINPYPWSNATSGVFPAAATHKASARPPTKVVDAGFGGGGAIGDFTFDATVTGL